MVVLVHGLCQPINEYVLLPSLLDGEHRSLGAKMYASKWIWYVLGSCTATRHKSVSPGVEGKIPPWVSFLGNRPRCVINWD